MPPITATATRYRCSGSVFSRFGRRLKRTDVDDGLPARVSDASIDEGREARTIKAMPASICVQSCHVRADKIEHLSP